MIDCFSGDASGVFSFSFWVTFCHLVLPPAVTAPCYILPSRVALTWKTPLHRLGIEAVSHSNLASSLRGSREAVSHSNLASSLRGSREEIGRASCRERVCQYV